MKEYHLHINATEIAFPAEFGPSPTVERICSIGFRYTAASLFIGEDKRKPKKLHVE